MKSDRRRKRRSALAGGERMFRRLTESVYDVVFSTDRGGAITYIGPQVIRYGYRPAEAVGRHFTHFVIPEDRHVLRREFARAVSRREQRFPREFRVRAKDGTLYWFEERGKAVRDKAGRVAGFAGVLRDVTERVRAEEALRESEAKFRTLAEQSPNMIFINKRGRVVYANALCERVTGYSREELCAPDFDYVRLQAPEYRERIRADFERQMRGEDVPSLEYTIVTRQGKRSDVLLNTRLIDYEGDRAILGVITDITEQKRILRELVETTAQLRALSTQLEAAEERARQRIAGGLHDDVAQTLAAVAMTAHALGTMKDPDRVAGATAKIQELVDSAIGNLRSLTFDLASPVLHSLGLGPALEDLCARMQSRHGIRFRFAGAREIESLSKERQIVIFQAVKELLFNAAKHSKGRGVRVTAEMKDGAVRVTVADDGVGMADPEAAIRVSPRGGFGLFHIRERIEGFGGSFRVRSSRGRGMEVQFVLPAAVE